MSVSTTDLDTAVAFFKALADESRLRIVGILARREASTDELARELDLRAPTVSHHLGRLAALGIVTMRKDGTSHLYKLDAKGLQTLTKRTLPPTKIASGVTDDASDAWERKVLGDYFEGERLTALPMKRNKRSVIYRWLATKFEPERDYPETQVNEIIKRHHDDTATIRRDMIGEGLLTRRNGIYRRVI